VECLFAARHLAEFQAGNHRGSPGVTHKTLLGPSALLPERSLRFSSLDFFLDTPAAKTLKVFEIIRIGDYASGRIPLQDRQLTLRRLTTLKNTATLTYGIA
jgi:hypothetical protein